jgi:hypothetical protein
MIDTPSARANDEQDGLQAGVIATTPAHTVRLIAPGEEAYAVSTLVEAFQRDPLAHWYFPDPSVRRASHRTLFDRLIRMPPRQALIEVTDDLEGVAVWHRPHDETLHEEAPIDEPPLEWSAEAMALFAAIDAATPPQPFWYLAFVGTRTRGGGRGSALLRHRLAALGQASVALWTGNEANLAFYVRFGLSPRSRHDVSGASAWWLTRGS